MIPRELAKKIRYIQIYTSKAVNDTLAGEYESVFKGRGMEFEEVRGYQAGDDVRNIDWNVTARTGEPYVKIFKEERELTVLFLVDLSASGSFGSVSRTKNEIAAEICALLAFSAIKNNDKVGLLVFTDRVEMFIPPAKGTTHVLRIIREVLNFSPGRSGTDIVEGIDYIGRVTNKKSVLFLVSDFIGEGYENKIRVLAKRHDLIAVSITDPREISMPDCGLVRLEDAETGEMLLIDTGSAAFRKKYGRLGNQRIERLRKLFRSMDVDHIEIMTDRDYLHDLIRFFRMRERRVSM
ncbi:MAG: DUF58 domain-containing protein [Deltaproteobacteria bacterium]|nr:DUF58 domain-containing protein [Deltaproteobacteria bacterium]